MKRKNIFQLSVLVLLGICVLLSLVAFDSPALRREPELLEISVIIREADSSAWSACRQGMEQAATDLQAELRFLTLSSADSVEEQRTLLRREVEVGADGVVLVPADPAALADDVHLASRETALVTMESDMSDSGAAAFISVDNAALGAALGQAALSGVPEGGTALLLRSARGSAGITQRLNEAGRVLEEAGRTVRLCVPADGESLAQMLEEALAAARCDAVLAFEPAALETAARTCQEMERPPLLYGMGVTATIASFLEQGVVTTMAAQNEFAAGYLAVEAAVQAALRHSLPPLEPLRFSLVRHDDMYDPENQKLLFPVTR